MTKRKQQMITEQMIKEYKEAEIKANQQKAIDAVNKLHELATQLGFRLIGIPKLENGLIVADWGIEWLK